MSTINAQSIINQVMAAHAIAPIKKDADFFSKIKIKTSDRGFHTILNCKENLQRFADMVRKNATAFGGGLIREAKQKPAISWPANLISLFKQSIEGHDYQAALDIGDKLGALFFIDNKGHAQMQVAPVPCEFEARLSSVCNEDGTYAVIFPQNMTSLSGSSFKAKRSRQSQIDNVQTALNARTNFNLSEALDKQSYSPVDQVAARAQWIRDHGLSAETIEARIVAHEVDSIEAMAAQDVAQVVAQAVTTIAISEAMQPSETAESRELVTCEAGESEAEAMARRIDRLTREVETGKTNNGGVICGLRPSAIEKRITQLAELGVTVGSVSGATWAPVPQYVPCPPDKTGLGDGPAPAFRGDDGDTPTPPPAEFLGESTPPVAATEYRYAMVNRPFSIGTAPKDGFLRIDARPGQNAPHHAMARHGIAVYDRQLSDKETLGFEMAPIADSAMLAVLCAMVYADMVEYVDGYIGMASKNWLNFQSHVMQALARLTASYRVSIPSDCDFADMVLKALAKTWATDTTPAPAPITPVAPSTPPVAISTDYAGDIPLSLAVSAYSGTSFSPDRRGQSAKSEYAATMASDYETMHAQAVKGGTLDLLPEVFARYRARQSSAYKAYLSSSSRCVSSFIAGPSNFPAARMNKRSDIAHKRLGEYLNGGEMALRAACRTLRPDLRAIMAGDVDAIDRLTVDISSAERTQDQMKAANKAIRANAKAGEAHQVAALMELGHSEAQALELLHPRFSRGQGFPSFSLTNNQANIRRMRARLEQITAAKARPVETVECANGVTLEDDAPANRVRLYFPGKPSEAIRDELKSSGFRWAPSVGAWQAYRNNGTLATAKRLAGEPVQAEESAQDAAPEAEIVPVVEIEAMAPAVESTETPAPTVTEFLPTSPVYQLPEKQDDWNGAKYSADFVPNARQQIVIDAVQTALNEGKYYTSDVLARCIELLNIDAHTASMNFGMRVEGGIVGMDCYYARGYIDAKKAREASLKTFNEMALREGDELGILVFTDYKRTTGVKITGISEGGSTFTFTGKRGINTVTGTGSADQLKCGIERAFTTGKRKTDYAAFIAAQAKRPTPTPPAVESQPIPPVVESKPNSEGERIRAAADKVRDQFPAIAAKYDDLAHSHDLKDEREARTGVNELSEQNLINAGVHPITAEIVERDGLSGFGAMAQAEILAKLESAKQAQDVPRTTHVSDSHGWEPAIGERYIGAVEYAVQEANKRGDGFEYRTGEDALMERRKNTAPTLRGEWLAATQVNRIESKSGKWTAWTFTTVMGAFGLGFMQWDNFVDLSDYMTAKDRMKALQGMARAVDEFTPPGGGLPCPEPVAVVEPVASVEPTPPPAVSSASPAPRVAVRRNFIPDNGLHIVEDSFEAWTFPSGARFAFVMYLGKSAKPWKYYGYSTEAKRDDGFNRHAQEARSIALSKANRKAESKAQAEKPHGLQVGDVVRSSWGYDQTNVDHYQIVKVIGKRTVEVRKLVEHKESTGDMTGRLAPVHGEFVGEVMRRQVDSLGRVNILQASYGRASKIEPLAIVHGVRCYAATSYSSYA